MTLDFYNLKEEPFGFLPDSRFLYLSSTHRQALGSLLFALQAGHGFVTLLAQPGLGKTTLLFHTLNSLGNSVATVYLFQAPKTPVELVRAILTDLGVRTTDEHVEGLSAQLKDVLLETHRLGKRVIVVIDEAQHLDTSILDLVCTFSNPTPGVKLIQFILCGRPSLGDKLAAIRPTQAIELAAAAHLEPFSAQDTAQYVDHRLRTAGYSRQSPLFTPEAAALVARYSQGKPRNINHLCYEALSTAYKHRREQIGADTIHEAAAKLDLPQPMQKTIVASPLPAPAAAQVTAKETARFVPQPVRPAIASPATISPAIANKTDRVSLLVGLPEPRPTLPAPKKPKEPKRALATPPLAVRLFSGPLQDLAIAAVLLLGVTGALVGMYRAQTFHPAGKQALAVSPLEIEAAAAATHPRMNAAPAPPAPIHDLKGMDLQSALRAISTRKQREQQDRIAKGLPAVH